MGTEWGQKLNGFKAFRCREAGRFGHWSVQCMYYLVTTISRKLDDRWPESVEERGLLLLVSRHYIARQYIKDVLKADEKNSIKTIYYKTIVCIVSFVYFLHTEAFNYTQKLLHTDPFTRRHFYTDAFTHRRFYTQTLLHTHTLLHMTLLHTEAFTHKSFYTPKLLHTETFTHRRFYTQTLLHTEAFTQTLLHTEAFTQALVHTEAFTHAHTHTHTLLHSEAFTQRSFYTQTLFHTEAF